MMRLLAFPRMAVTWRVMAEMFSGPLTARAWIMHLDMSSWAMVRCWRIVWASLSLAAIFRGSPYMPTPTRVSLSAAVRPSYSGFSVMSSSRRFRRFRISSSFLVSSVRLFSGCLFWVNWLAWVLGCWFVLVFVLWLGFYGPAFFVQDVLYCGEFEGEFCVLAVAFLAVVAPDEVGFEVDVYDSSA